MTPKKGTIETRNVKLTIFGSTITSGAFAVDFFYEVESRQVPTQYSLYTDVTPECGLKCSLQKSKGHQVLADIFYTRFIEGKVAASLESLAVLPEGLDSSSEGCVLQPESHRKVCESTESE